MDERANMNAGSTAEPGDGRVKAPEFEDVKRTVADKLHEAAGAVRNLTRSSDPQSSIGCYGHQASEILYRSADYVRRFDYERTDTQIKDYVRQHPGRSLLIAGAAGLIIGVLVRRR
jgi:ElaB/YqjD/DUF883 family membrane-anchored ribosome-binding protein